MKRTFLPFLLLLALLTGCRYEDGPLVSFRSPWTRLTMHPKKITRLEMDGVDYLPMFNADFPNSTFRFTKEGHWGYYIIYWSSDRFPQPVWARMGLSFSESKFQDISILLDAADRSKPDVLDFVDISMLLKYKHLLVADINGIAAYRVWPVFEILKLTANVLDLKGMPLNYGDPNPHRLVTFKSL